MRTRTIRKTLAIALSIIATATLAPASGWHDGYSEWEADLVQWANSKTTDEMEEVSGIGPVTAARIIAARPHTSIETIDDVAGIGPKTIHKIIVWIRDRRREEH